MSAPADPSKPETSNDAHCGGATSSQQRVFLGWYVVAGCFLVYFVNGGAFSTGTVFFKALTREFGWSRGELAGAFSLGFVLAGVSAPLWGRLADRRGARASFVPGILMSGVFFLALSRIHGLGTLYLFYVLLAIGSAGISVVPIGVLLSRWFVRRRGRAIGIAYTGVGFGQMALAPVAGLLVTTVGWRGGYVACGLTILMVLLPIALWIPERPELFGLRPDGDSPERPARDSAAAKQPAGAGPGVSLGAAVRMPVFWLVAATWFLTQMALAGVSLHQVPFMTDSGLSTRTASVVAGAVGGAGILGRLGFGLLAERRSVPALYAGCYLLYAAGAASLALSPRLGALALAGYAALFGVGVGGSWALTALLVGDLFGTRALGEIFGSLGLLATIGGATGGWGAGVLFDRSGSYALALGLAIAFSLVGAGLMGWVHRIRTRRDPFDAAPVSRFS